MRTLLPPLLLQLLRDFLIPSAQRIRTFVNIVGEARVIAGSDCGFGTFAGFGAVDPEIAYAKLSSLAQGAVLALQ